VLWIGKDHWSLSRVNVPRETTSRACIVSTHEGQAEDGNIHLFSLERKGRNVARHHVLVTRHQVERVNFVRDRGVDCGFATPQIGLEVVDPEFKMTLSRL
jgi:hypothetical protein